MKKLISLFTLSILLIFALESSAQVVYATKTGKKYHAEGCRYLSQSKIQMDLSTAINKGLEPCSVCKPVTVVASKPASNATPVEKAQQKQVTKTSPNISAQCIAITKAGTRCSRRAEVGSVYCWQHKK